MKLSTAPFKSICLTNILFMLFFLLSMPSSAQTLIDSSCTKYFQITDRLKKGDTLSRTDWKKFISDKAIVDYMNDQGVDEAYFESYRKNMQIVYMPQNEVLLQKRLTEPFKYWLTYMIYQYKKNETGMKAYLQRIENDPQAYFNTCYQYAYTALPKSAHKKLPELKVAIIPIHNDAHAQDGLIIYTLLCAYMNDYNRPGALGGHELHHMLRPQPNFEIKAEDDGVVMAMYRVLNEGSADMVDKKYMTDTASRLLPTQRYYQEFFDEGKKILPHMDSLLQTGPELWTKLKTREFFEGTPYSSGHVPGTYMSHYIEKNDMKTDLLKSLDDPFYFFLIYDRAAKKDKDHPFSFSTTAIKNIKQLRKKYISTSAGTKNSGSSR
ncbi:MAG: hypothetical protein MUP99_02235 [Pedobacter sp.]|nr:hypothetical protein [Pedobacter sp.]